MTRAIKFGSPTAGKIRAERVIRRWQAAYEAANNKPAPELWYRNGWIRRKDGTGWRVGTVENMAIRLEQRAGIEP